MELLEKLKHKMALLVTVGSSGYVFGGSFIGTLLAVPFIFLFLFVFSLLSAQAAYGLIAIAAVLVLLLVQSVLHFDRETVSPSNIIIDKVFGIFIALHGLDLSLEHWKLYVFGFGLFHILLFIEPAISIGKSQWRISKLPGGLGVVLDDIFCGAFVNILLRFAFFLNAGS